MHKVWFLLLPGFPLVDVSSMLAVFEGANALRHDEDKVAAYAVQLVSIEGRAVCSSSGVLLAAQVLPHRLEGNTNSLVIAGGPRAGSEPAGTSDVQRLQGWFSNNQQHLVRCAAVDVDALALAPTSAPARQRANPVSASRLALEARRSDWTAASPVSPRWRLIEAGQGTDLALSWLEADQGSAFADTLAERLPEPRSRRYGPMRYRSSLIDQPAPDPRIAMLHAWIAAHLHERLDVARLAQRFAEHLRIARAGSRHRRSNLRTTCEARHRWPVAAPAQARRASARLQARCVLAPSLPQATRRSDAPSDISSIVRRSRNTRRRTARPRRSARGRHVVLAPGLSQRQRHEPCFSPEGHAPAEGAATRRQDARMPNIASILKAEISRVARKEVRAEIETLKKASVAHRASIAELRRQVSALEKEIRRVTKGTTRTAATADTVNEETIGTKRRFSASRLATHRSKLGLSAASYGQLVGVSGQTVYHWEQGKARATQLENLAAVRGLGAREIAQRLSEK